MVAPVSPSGGGDDRASLSNPITSSYSSCKKWAMGVSWLQTVFVGQVIATVVI